MITINKIKKYSFLIWTLIIILILSFIAVGICIFLAFQDDYQDKYIFDRNDTTLMYTALKGSVSGKEFTLSENQVNTYINDEIVGQSNDIKNLRIYFNNGITEIYSKVSYMNHDFVLYSKADIFLDTMNNNFNINLYDAKIGKLPINDFILKNIISANIRQTENASVKDGIILIRSSYNFNIDSFILTLTFKEFTVGDKIINCRTNSLASDALDVLIDALQTSEGREKLKHLFKVTFSPESIIEFGLDNIHKIIPKINDIKDNISDIKDNIISRFS